MKKNVRLRTFSFLICLVLVSGCGVWQNFTTYFNLYYNTQQTYETALADIEALRENIFDLKEPKITKDINTNLDKVIEKGSKILQYDSESAYVDDALFMTGVAFYYKEQYAKAVRKFKELSIQEEEDYKFETRLWLAKSYLQLREFDQGSSMLEELKNDAIAAEKKDILKDTYRTLVAYQINRDNINAAITEAVEMLNAIDDNELKAQISYQIGMLYLGENQTEEAISSFENVLNYSPDFETEFKSKFEIAKLKKQLGEREESYKRLQALYNEGKYKEYWGDVYYEMGLMQYEDGNSEKAFEIFSEVDTVYASTEGAGRSELMLGEILKNEYADYDSALIYYNKVSKSKASEDIKKAAKENVNSINSYLGLKKDIRENKKRMNYIEDPNSFIRDSLAYKRYLRSKGVDENSQIPGVNGREERFNRTEDEVVETNENEVANEIADSDSSLVSDSLATDSSSDEFNFDNDEEYIVKEKPERPKVSLDSLKAELQTKYFQLGNLFFIDYQKPDSAFYYYSEILNSSEDVKDKPKILFALGTYYESTGEQDKADSLYNLIYNEYKTHRVANEAALKLGKPPLIIEEDPAEKLYREAEDEIDKSNTDSAFVLLTQVAENYPASIYALKSIYTKGWLYENVKDEPDSAINMYSKLVEDFKNSLYASNVKDKVEAYNIMLEEKAAEDSIAAISENKEPEQVEIPNSDSQPVQNEETVPEQDANSIIKDSLSTDSKIEKIDIKPSVTSDSAKVNDTIPTPMNKVERADSVTVKKKLLPQKEILKPVKDIDSVKADKKIIELDSLDTLKSITDSSQVVDSSKVIK